jgi:hypothetical protein
MWISILVFIVAVFAVVGGALAGGVYTIVLIPLALVVVGSAILYSALGRAAERNQSKDGSGGTSGPTPGNALPRTHRRSAGHVRTSPEGLSNARREQQ